MCQSMISDHLKFLLAICKELTSSEVEDMKFLCQEHIPSGTLEAADALGLVNLLLKTGLVRKGKLRFLHDLLVHIGRVDLASKISVDLPNGNENGWPISNVEAIADGTTATITTTTTVPTARLPHDDWRGNYRVKMVKDLGADVFEQLGFYLNPKTMRNWVTLAGRLGYTHTQAMNFKLVPTQSTQLLLHDWSSSPDATVQKLYDTLQVSLRRHDAAEVLEPFLGTKPKETLIL